MSVAVTQNVDHETVSRCPVMGDILFTPVLALERTHYMYPSRQNAITTNLEKTSKDQCPSLAVSPQFFTTSDASLGKNPHSTLITTPETVKTKKLLFGTGPHLSARLAELLEGIDEPGVFSNPLEPPEWLDRELFDCGRRFYQRYLFCLSFSELLSLVLFLSTKLALPLIYTRRSDNPMKARTRYFSTLLHLITWFSGDVWDPNDRAHKDVLAIRLTHHNLGILLNSSTNIDKVSTMDVTKIGHPEPSDPLNPTIRQDLQSVANSQLPQELSNASPLHISQLDMSLTQCSFMGLIVAHPYKLGAGGATQEDMAGFIHFWRGIGWLLGIKDKYNFCNGSVAQVRDLCLEVERLFAIPSLAAADWNYEHMASSLITGMGYSIPCMSYPAMFRYLSYTLDIPIPAFVKRMSFKDTYNYWVMRATFTLCNMCPWLVTLMAGLVKLLLIRFRG